MSGVGDDKKAYKYWINKVPEAGVAETGQRRWT